MRVEIVSIGEELLSGDSDIIDTNSIYITKQLASVGLRVLYKTTVGDDEQRITDVLNIALNRADIIITTGGLGPTVDDITRQGVARTTARELVFHQELLDEIAAKFARFNSRMSDNNRLQAMIPDGAMVLHNAVGTAPGFIIEHEGKAIISVPGVPREMKYLMENAVMPYLAEKFGATGIIKVRVLRTAGIGESLIDERIGELEKLENPTVGLAAHAGQTDIRIYARAKTDAEADKLITDVEEEIRRRMGSFIYGVDKEPLESAFINVLRAANMGAAAVEAGTGGQLRKRIESQLYEGEAVRISTDVYHSVAELLQSDVGANLGSDKSFYRNKSDITPEDYRQLTEQLAATLREKHNAGLGMVIISEEKGTAIAIASDTETRSRTYGFGGIAYGGPEWATGWALSMGWHMISTTINTLKQAEQ